MVGVRERCLLGGEVDGEEEVGWGRDGLWGVVGGGRGKLWGEGLLMGKEESLPWGSKVGGGGKASRGASVHRYIYVSK